MTDSDVETGKPTIWDNAWREGHAYGLARGAGISYRDAYLRTTAMLRGEPDRPQAQNQRGEWVPAIPLPLFTFPHRRRCSCKRAFWTTDGYRGHYAAAHIIDGKGGTS